jgi:nucleotide-binding universal stress UspA family protein
MGDPGLKRLLVPTDFSTPSLAALPQAVRYTQASGGAPLLLHVVKDEPRRWYVADGRSETPLALVDPTAPFLLPQPPRTYVCRDLSAEAAWKLAAWLPPQPDRFRALVTGGQAAEEIVRVARAQDADLILLGTHDRRGAPSMALERPACGWRPRGMGPRGFGIAAMGHPESWVPHTPSQRPVCRGDRSQAQIARSHAA